MPATLYGANVSPFVRKVRAYLALKGIDYTLEPVNPFDPPAGYRDISPLGKIPAWRDDDVTLADSSVILLYLERRHSTPPLYPQNARPGPKRCGWRNTSTRASFPRRVAAYSFHSCSDR
jgi:glutathione S-transferase